MINKTLTTIVAALGIATTVAMSPAIAGVEPSPFLDLVLSTPPDDSSVAFEVGFPPSPVIPIEILSLSLVSTDPLVNVLLIGRANGRAAFVDFDLDPAGSNPPDDGTPVGFDLLFEFASYMGSKPVGSNPPDDNMPGPASTFEVLFDVLFNGAVAHHVANFEVASGFLFSGITVEEGSVKVGFDLTGPYTTGGPDLFSVTITGSADPIPEPGTLMVFIIGLAGIGAMRQRPWASGGLAL